MSDYESEGEEQKELDLSSVRSLFSSCLRSLASSC